MNRFTRQKHRLSWLLSRRLRGVAAICCLAVSAMSTLHADDILDLLPTILGAIDQNQTPGSTSVTDLQGNQCTVTPNQQSMLDLHNAARQSGQVCGTTAYPAAPALRWHCGIGEIASSHSNEMQANRNLTHTGNNGSDAGDRLSANGYSWNSWGENIAAGRTSAGGTMSQWLDSPPHCANLMDPAYREIGVAPDQPVGNYWTAVFGSRG